jgi:hypothetical protein
MGLATRVEVGSCKCGAIKDGRKNGVSKMRLRILMTLPGMD